MKYKTVVIDPPWSLNFNAGERVASQQGGYYACQDKIYDLMPLEDIFDFPINDFAADESMIFLWVTNGKIEQKPVISIGYELLERWGFEYHNMITWVKPSATCIFSPLMVKTEHVLLGWRGNFRTLTDKQNAVMSNVLVESGYALKHSQKPSRFYQLLRGWTPKPRIDIFARRAHEGFDGWGDEYVGNSDEGTLLEFMEKESS